MSPPKRQPRRLFAARDDRFPIASSGICTKIFPDWDAWQARLRRARPEDRRVRRAAGHAGAGGRQLLAALKLRDEIGQLEYKVWYFASLWYDQDQRDNEINAQAPAGADSVRQGGAGVAVVRSRTAADSARRPCRSGWRQHAELAVYRFAIEDLYRQQEHVLDDKGERLLSLVEPLLVVAERRLRGAVDRRREAPDDHAVERRPRSTLTYGQYRAILATNRNQADRAAAFHAFHKRLRRRTSNTYASLYNGVLQRDWFHAQARGYASTLDAALHGNNIPTAVVENLIAHDQGRHRAAAPLSPPAEARARARHLPLLRHVDPARRVRSQVPVRRRARLAAGVGGAARRRLSASRCATCSTGSASTSTRTRASAAARIRRRSTACSRTCC